MDVTAGTDYWLNYEEEKHSAPSSWSVSAGGPILLVLLGTREGDSFLSVDLRLSVTTSIYLLLCGRSLCSPTVKKSLQ